MDKLLPMLNHIQELEELERVFSIGKLENVLEWGSGISTIYFPVLAKNLKLWVSVEHNVEWWKKIHSMNTSPLVSVNFFKPNDSDWKDDCGRNGTYEEFKNYVDYPSTLGVKFDFIFVDGRARVDCMRVSTGLLKENGILVLHDCLVPHYKEGIDYFDKVKRVQTLQFLKLKSQENFCGV